MKKLFLCAVLLALLCLYREPEWSYTCAPRSVYRNPSYVEHGIASWYGPRFYGKRTAGGAVLAPHSRWVAHKTLPFGTRVCITNLRTGKSVEAEVRDRGPYVAGRIVDLTEALAHELGIHHCGIAWVQLVVLHS